MIFYEQVTCRYFVGEFEDIKQIVEQMNEEYKEKGVLYTNRYYEYFEKYIEPLTINVPITKHNYTFKELFKLLPAKYRGEDSCIICI